MNDTFLEFSRFLKENSKEIRSGLIMDGDSPLRDLYQKVFDRHFIRYERVPVPVTSVSSTDSSEFVRELYNGKKLILIRAYTFFGSNTHTSFIPLVQEVSRDHVQAYLTMLMEHSEHLSILNMLREEKPEYILVDGSFSGRVTRYGRMLNAEMFREFHDSYFQALREFLSISQDREIPVIYISKSSESRKFKRFLLNELTSSEIPVDKSTVPDSSDHFLVRSLAVERGYTEPLTDTYEIGRSGVEVQVSTIHVVPEVFDLPIKVEVIDPRPYDSTGIAEDIVNLVFWGYGSIKNHNIWLSQVDKMVKFRSAEMENVYMKAFESEIGVEFYETRGERRARLRV